MINLKQEIAAAGMRRIPGAIPHGEQVIRGKLFGFLPWIMVWNIVIIVVVAIIFYWLAKSSHRRKEEPLDILNRRYASGEIDKKTYLEMKKDISI